MRKPALQGGLSGYNIGMSTAPRAPHFDWCAHYRCNMDCTYCWFHAVRSTLEPANYYPGSEAVLSTWRRIREKYGECEVSIGGGEPMIYPDCNALYSALTELHRVTMVTNLSQEINTLARLSKKGRLEISVTFHPESVSLEKFSAAAQKAWESGVVKNIWLVAWPPFLDKIAAYHAEFARHGMEMLVFPFWGFYEGREYPHSYTGDQLALIKPFLVSRGGAGMLTVPKKTAGMLCRAGQLHADVHPNGNAYRCGGENYKGLKPPIGNIFAPDFELLPGPTPCRGDSCPHNEWAFLLEHPEELKD